MTTFSQSRAALTAPDAGAARAAAEHLDRLTKPAGSLGRLESLAIQLAGMAGVSPPPIPEHPAVAVFAGDHGVLAQGVSPWPQEVTAQMVANFCAGGAAINVLARQVGARVVVVDVGVATEIPDVGDALIRARVAPGTADLFEGPAMTSAQMTAALDVGVAVAERLIAEGADCLVTGDMGIANTTPSAAIIAALTGLPAVNVTGRGTGIDDERLAGKVRVIEHALLRLPPDPDPLLVLAEVGGLEIAALVGFIVAGAAARKPVLVDGVIAGAALLVAASAEPAVMPYVIAGHRSIEPGASAVLGRLRLQPVLDLELRLGEGTGACLALPVVQAAARVLIEMATFDSAGVTEK
jgi:nicotinate-nucleotide--dimethylbenzimidazole phosphoribosyltransferase